MALLFFCQGLRDDLSFQALFGIRFFQAPVFVPKPQIIRCANGPEYISAVTLAWVAKRSILIDFIHPGRPQQNAYVERYNRTVRYDWLAHHLFETPDGTQNFATR